MASITNKNALAVLLAENILKNGSNKIDLSLK